jgi:hypothetical protein
VEIIASMIAFFALVAAWFVLPSTPPVLEARSKQSVPEALATAA